MKFFASWLATAIGAAVAVVLLPGLVPMGEQLSSIAIFALAISLVNASVKPVMQFLALPLTVLTLGFFYLVVNALMLMLCSWLTANVFHIGVYVSSFWSAFLGAIIISVVSTIVSSIIEGE